MSGGGCRDEGPCRRLASSPPQLQIVVVVVVTVRSWLSHRLPRPCAGLDQEGRVESYVNVLFFHDGGEWRCNEEQRWYSVVEEHILRQSVVQGMAGWGHVMKGRAKQRGDGEGSDEEHTEQTRSDEGAGTSCKHTVWSGRTEAQLPALCDRDRSRAASSLFVFLRVTLSARASPLPPSPSGQPRVPAVGQCSASRETLLREVWCTARRLCGAWVRAQGLGVRRTGQSRHLSRGVVRAWPVPAVKDGRVWRGSNGRIMPNDQLRVETEREESHVYPSIPFRPQGEEADWWVSRRGSPDASVEEVPGARVMVRRKQAAPPRCPA
ncbi:hypothetical protein O3P69_013151 [Scylla paramamosain]|uniref:Uncharacterized protein n=1 Tax=Scylla paramamosain TaxID=85552 RepID=A0AAW0U0S1_SCYPA